MTNTTEQWYAVYLEGFMCAAATGRGYMLAPESTIEEKAALSLGMRDAKEDSPLLRNALNVRDIVRSLVSLEPAARPDVPPPADRQARRAQAKAGT